MSSYFIGDTTVYTTVTGASLVGTDRLPVVIAAGGGTYGVLHQIQVSELLTVFQPYNSNLVRIAALTDPDSGTGTGTGSAGSESPLLYWDNVSSQFNWLDLGYGLMVSGGTLVLDPTAAKSALGLVIGTDVQAYDADLAAIAALTTASYGRSLLTLASAAALASEVDVYFLTPAEGNAAYQPLDATLTALAALTIAANTLTIGTGTDAFSQTSFAANTFPARASTGSLAAKSITDASLTQLAAGLGTASVKDTGTSGATVPLLNGANTWSAAQTVVAASAAGKPLVVQGAASQSANLAEFQNSSGTAYVTVGPPTLASDGSQRFFKVVGTVPGGIANEFDITSSNTVGSNQYPLFVRLRAGYTQNGFTASVFGTNTVAGTGTDPIGSGNAGGYFEATGTTTGTNMGCYGWAQGGNYSIGLLGWSTAAKNSATNVGVLGLGRNTGTSAKQIGGYFGLNTGTTTIATYTSAALMCDNYEQTADIFVARDNGNPVLVVADGGTTVVRQGGGTPGTDELQLSHTGSVGIIESKDGAVRIIPSGTVNSNTLNVGTVGGGVVGLSSSGSNRLLVDAVLASPGASTGWAVDANGNLAASTPTWALFRAHLVEANTAGSGSPNIITQAETDSVYTNEGATAENYHTLPTAAAGLVFTFVVQDSDGIRITASAGDTIRPIAGTAASATAGYIRCATQGAFIRLLAINATEWIAIGSSGTWTIDS